MKLQERPFSIQVEFTEGCNRGCGFCGLRGMRERKRTILFHDKRNSRENSR